MHQLAPDEQNVNINGNCDMLIKFHSFTDTQAFCWISLFFLSIADKFALSHLF